MHGLRTEGLRELFAVFLRPFFMATNQSDVRLNVEGLKKFKQALVRGGQDPRIGVMYKRWSAFYRSAMQRRYVKFSRGGGTWVPLAASTRAKRRKGNKKVAILRDTSTMFLVLTPTVLNPGAISNLRQDGIHVGFGGGASHPETKRFTIAGLANAHHRGEGNLPARPILTMPPTPTVKQMQTEAGRTLQDITENVALKELRPL